MTSQHFFASCWKATTLKSTVEKLDGAVTVEGSVKYQVNAAIAKLVNNAPEKFDTLKEIADWIGNDTTGHIKEVADILAAIGTAGSEGTAGSGLHGKIETETARAITAENELDRRIDALEAAKHKTSSQTATSGKYISGITVDETGALTITETALPTESNIVAGGDNKYVSASASGHTVSVELTYGTVDGTITVEDGVAKTANGTVQNGLAKAEDVAAVILANEKVVAAAFNDHEGRIDAIETFDFWETYTA